MRKFVVAIACVCALASLSAPAARAATEPVVSTGNAIAITATSARLIGSVNPSGQATSYFFEYGTTTSYGSQTAMSGAGSGTTAVDVAAAVGSLVPGTTYHYRLVATNASGTALGSDVSFHTPALPAPVAVTGHAGAVTQTSATLTGRVNPQGSPTTYVIQYGTSNAYSSETPVASAGSGTKSVAVSVPIASLTPNTTYHYRVAATNANGTTLGNDASFSTLPAGLTLAALPSTITFGELTSLRGRVLPAGPPQLTATLQSAASPAGPWINVESRPVASTGAYSFPGLNPTTNTYYRVLCDGVTSPAVLVSVRFSVNLFVTRRNPPAGSLVRFHGHVSPGHRGHLVLVQRLGPRGRWVTIRFARLRGLGAGFSFYRVAMPIRRSGTWRVVVLPDGAHRAGVSPAVRIRVR